MSKNPIPLLDEVTIKENNNFFLTNKSNTQTHTHQIDKKKNQIQRDKPVFPSPFTRRRYHLAHFSLTETGGDCRQCTKHCQTCLQHRRDFYIDTLTGETGPPTLTLTLNDRQDISTRRPQQDTGHDYVQGPDLQDLTLYLNTQLIINSEYRV